MTVKPPLPNPQKSKDPRIAGPSAVDLSWKRVRNWREATACKPGRKLGERLPSI